RWALPWGPRVDRRSVVAGRSQRKARPRSEAQALLPARPRRVLDRRLAPTSSSGLPPRECAACTDCHDDRVRFAHHTTASCLRMPCLGLVRRHSRRSFGTSLISIRCPARRALDARLSHLAPRWFVACATMAGRGNTMARTPLIEQQVTTGSFILNVENVGLTSDQFLQLCSDNRDLRFELTAQKELVIMPPPGADTSRRNVIITTELTIWARKDGTGITFDPACWFILPNGANRAPDAAWLKRERWDALSAE